MLRYAQPAIRYGDMYKSVSFLCGADIFGFQRQRPSFRHSLTCIDHEVLDHLAKLPCVCLNQPEVVSQNKLTLGSRTVDGEAGRFLQQTTDLDNFLDRLTTTGKSEQLPGQVGGSCQGIFTRGKPCGCLMPFPYLHTGEGDVADDNGEDVIEVMGDAAGQNAQGFELLL